MGRNIKTYIFCFDDHRAFSEDVKKRFTDTARYKVFSFPTREELLHQLDQEREHSYCKIAILGVHDAIEQFEIINEITIDVKKIDHRIGLILLGPPEKMEEIKKAIRLNIDAYIPKNANSVLRIHNIVKKLISEHNIRIFRKRRNFSLYTLLFFILLTALLIIIAYLRLPYFF